MPRQRRPRDPRHTATHRLFPGGEIGRVGKRREHDELHEGHARLLCHRDRRLERSLAVVWQPGLIK